MQLALTSPAFTHGQPIPRKYTCDGEDVSPPLSWTGVPPDAKSLALIADDPDAPVGTWVHWVLFDIPPDKGGLPEHVPATAESDGAGVHGSNSWQHLGYGGPCPPGGTHRYFFKLYALDTLLALPTGAGKAQLLSAMEGHVLARTELMGTYQRR